MVYVIQLASNRIRAEGPDPVTGKLYDIYHCCVYSEKLYYYTLPSTQL